MFRFFLLDFLLGGAIMPGERADLSSLSHQLSRVLRLKPGDQILLLDGAGFEYPTEIIELDRGRAYGIVRARRSVDSEPAVRLTLYQCSLKADKFEWVLQKGTELGVAAFVPVISQRSVVRPAETLLRKYDRWRAIIREAAEQSGRGRLPHLAEPLPFAAAVDTAGDSRYLPWVEAGMQAESIGLGQAVARQSGNRPSISLMIGPEGGLAADEAGMARTAGWQIVTLGPRILRAETAALASVTIVLDRLLAFGEKHEQGSKAHEQS